MPTPADLPSPAGLGPSPAPGPGEEHEAATTVSPHRTVRVAWIAVGFVAVGVGGVGVVVPGLPTTVFFVIATWAFSRSSPRFERWVLGLPGIGGLVRDHRDGLGMPRRAKVVACSMIVVACTLSATFGFSTWPRGPSSPPPGRWGWPGSCCGCPPARPCWPSGPLTADLRDRALRRRRRPPERRRSHFGTGGDRPYTGAMSDASPTPTGTPPETGTFRVKRGLAEMLRGGVIMDVVDPEQARIAEDAGAVAVMALERVPSDIRRDGGVARMSDPEMIEGIKAVTTIPVMAKARIGHFVEAQILESLGVDFVDESEVLTPADEAHHIDKWAFTVPFVCGATNLGEALRRISEGACMIRSKGEAGTGNIVEAVRHLRSILGDVRRLTQADPAEQFDWAKRLGAPLPLVQEVAATGRLPVPLFCAGGIATPADAALTMQLGAEATFVGSGIFKSDDPARRAKAIVEATTHFRNPEILAKVSRGLGPAMPGLEVGSLETTFAERGW